MRECKRRIPEGSKRHAGDPLGWAPVAGIEKKDAREWKGSESQSWSEK